MNDLKLRMDQIISFGEFRDPATGEVGYEYRGQYLYREVNGNLVLGLCSLKSKMPAYRPGDRVYISYSDLEQKRKYKVATQVAKLHIARHDEDFEVRHDMVDQLEGNFDKYIIELAVMGKPEIATQREFFRLPLQTEIYCKASALQEAGKLIEMTESQLMMNIAKAQAQAFKQEISGGLSEAEAGYFKVVTEDISAGGFMFRSSYRFGDETCLGCMIMVDRAVLPAAAKVLRTREAPVAGRDSGKFMIHVQFYKMREAVRDRLVRHLVAAERQIRREQMKRPKS